MMLPWKREKKATQRDARIEVGGAPGALPDDALGALSDDVLGQIRGGLALKGACHTGLAAAPQIANVVRL